MAPSRVTIPATDVRQSALELTLDPVSPETFFEEHWEREPLVVSRGEPSRFETILSLADAERIVSESAIRTPAIKLVRNGQPIPPSTYTLDRGWAGGSFTGLARVDRVAEEYAAGATVILHALQFNWHPIALYCRDLARSLGCDIQANAYWTPATAQGFNVHHDTHDVFILQLGGRKRWRIYDPVVELPLKDQKWKHGSDDAGSPVKEVLLEPGDTLFLPRGCPHDANTEEGDSLHLTVGLHILTRLDAIKAALNDCGDEVEFRRSVGADGTLPHELLDSLMARLGPDEVAQRARRRLIDNFDPVLDDQLAQVRDLDHLAVDDPLVKRQTVISDVEESETEAVLRFEGKELTFPAQAREALAGANAADGEFTAADLPGSLDDAGRLVLVRRLVREGFLRRV